MSPRRHVNAYAEAFGLVFRFFDGDIDKTDRWLGSRVPLLGELTPREYAGLKGWPALLKWIRQQLAENEPTPAVFRFIYPEDPECSLLRNDIRCRKCWSCLRAIYGQFYYLKGVS